MPRYDRNKKRPLEVHITCGSMQYIYRIVCYDDTCTITLQAIYRIGITGDATLLAYYKDVYEMYMRLLFLSLPVRIVQRFDAGQQLRELPRFCNI